MDLIVKTLFTILGLGAVVTFVERLQIADWIYGVTRGLPQPVADIFGVVVIVIIVAAASSLERGQ